MIRLSGIVSALFACVASMSLPVIASMTPQQTIRGMVGKWSCVTHDDTNKEWRASTTDSIYGPWLRLNESYGAQNSEPAGTAVKFLGFDSSHRRWIVTSVDSSGGYYVIYSASHSFDGSKWKDGFPADKGTASIKVVNPNIYVFNAASPDERGRISKSHTVCTRIFK